MPANRVPTLVGREAELAEFGSVLDEAVRGHGATVLVSGEAGVGKTRLVGEAIQVARAKEFRVLSAPCLYESRTPYLPLIEALRSGGLQRLLAEETPRIEAAYVVTKTGLLVKEVVRNGTRLDPNIFASMLVTVGEFVRDSLAMLDGDSGGERLNRLGYGGFTILIEGGATASLVAILTGEENEFLLDDLRETLGDIERAYGGVLERWSGDDERVAGVERGLQRLLSQYDGVSFGRSDPKARRNLLFENVAGGLARQSGRTPTLLCLEDLQWADPSTLALLHYVARGTRDVGLVLIGTYRPEDLTAADGRARPLAEWLQALAREDLARAIELPRLPRQGTAAVLRSVLGESESLDDILDRVHGDAAGNPLFIIELARWMEEKGIVRRTDGTWVLDRDVEGIGIPERVHDLIRHRVDRLDPSQRELLDVASAIGERFRPGVLAAALGRRAADVWNGLRAIERAHRLLHGQDSAFGFDHVMIREVLYADLPADLRREYHGLIAAALERQSGEGMETVTEDLAYHYFRSRDRAKAFPYLVKAGERAVERYANAEAVRFYQRALEAEPPPESRRALLVTLGDLFAILGNLDKSLWAYENARERWRGTEGEPELLAKIADVRRKQGKPEEAMGLCREAVRLASPSGGRGRALALEVMGHSCLDTGAYEDAQTHYAAAASAWEAAGDERGFARVARGLGDVYAHVGKPQDALQQFEESARIMERVGDYAGVADALQSMGDGHLHSGEYARALQFLEMSIGIFRKVGDQAGAAKSLNMIGIVLRKRGEYDKALAALERARRIALRIGDKRRLASALNNIGNVKDDTGDRKAAEGYFEESIALMEEIGNKSGAASVLNNLGNLACHAGRYERALDCYERSLRISEEAGHELATAYPLYNIGNIHAERGEYEAAFPLLERALRVGRDLGDHGITALTLTRLGDAHTDLGRFEEARRLVRESREVSERVGNRPEVGRADCALAETFLREGRTEEAMEACARALALLRGIGAKEPLARALRILGEAQMSRGEQEKAANALEEGLRLSLEIGDPRQIGLIHLAYATVQRAQGTAERAREHLSAAADIFRRCNLQRDLERAMSSLVDRTAETGRQRTLGSEEEGRSPRG